MKSLRLLALLLPISVYAQRSSIDSLDMFIQKQVADFRIPGLAVGIIKGGDVIFKKGYGVNSTVDSVPISTQTLFPILSCTKAFTAAAVGILVDRGKLHWNDKVVQHLPHFKLSDDRITRELTISDILSHRSGLETFEGDLLWYGTDYSREEVVRRIRYSPLRSKFRSAFGYQNVMYLVAALIIQKVSGESWEDFIKKEILLPLSMKQTSTSITAIAGEKDYAQPHIQNKPIPHVNMDNIAPAGGVISSVDDLLHWLKLWIDQGTYKGTPILSKASYETITREKIKMGKGSKEGYGFGWSVETSEGIKVLSHSGGMPGYKSLIIVLPGKKIGIVVLTNQISYINEQLAGIITDYLMAKSIDWQQADRLFGENFRFSWDEQPDTSHPNLTPEWSPYQGVYEDAAYGKAEIEVRDGKAFLTLLPAKKLLTGPLYYLDKNKVKIVFKDPFIPAGEVLFYEGEDKKIKGFRLNVESSDFHFKYLDFIKKSDTTQPATEHL